MANVYLSAIGRKYELNVLEHMSVKEVFRACLDVIRNSTTMFKINKIDEEFPLLVDLLMRNNLRGSISFSSNYENALITAAIDFEKNWINLRQAGDIDHLKCYLQAKYPDLLKKKGHAKFVAQLILFEFGSGNVFDDLNRWPKGLKGDVENPDPFGINPTLKEDIIKLVKNEELRILKRFHQLGKSDWLDSLEILHANDHFGKTKRKWTFLSILFHHPNIFEISAFLLC